MKKRLFISIPLPKEITGAFSALQDRTRYRQLRWVDPSQFHVTVCFLGDVEEELLVLISEALSSVVAKAKPFDLHLQKIGLFPPKIARPTMVWGFFQESEFFEDLVHQTKDSLMKADTSFMRLAEEWRKDIPHVTMARFRGNDYPRAFDPTPPLTLRVDRLEIMESVLYPDGLMYTSLASFPFHTK